MANPREKYPMTAAEMNRDTIAAEYGFDKMPHLSAQEAQELKRAREDGTNLPPGHPLYVKPKWGSGDLGDTGITMPAADRISIALAGRQVGSIVTAKEFALGFPGKPRSLYVEVSEPGQYVVIRVA